MHGGWLIAALGVAALSLVIVYGFQTGSCQDSLNPAASSCTHGSEPFAIFVGLTGAAFVVFALIRSFRRK